jgi:hypothetical protein
MARSDPADLAPALFGKVRPVSVAAVLESTAFEEELRKYLFERAEEARAVRVGEKEVSEQAEIIARYASLFTREQLDALRQAEGGAAGDERERLYRLRKTCEGGLIAAELAEAMDALENAELQTRVTFRGEEMPLRAAQARLAVLPEYRDRDQLGAIQAEASAALNPQRLDLLNTAEPLAGELSGIADPVARSDEEKAISLRDLSDVLERASADTTEAWQAMRERWFDRLLGEDREDIPLSFHTPYMRRLSPLEDTYTKDRATEVCLATIERLGFSLRATTIRLDLDDRPQKNPRACVIASDPPEVVHLITRAQGGLHDYQAFLHEAGHALHYAGCDPSLPYTFRKLSRDHALTEIYSYIFEAISREPAWHAEYFGLSDEEAEQNAEATLFLEALLFRRYVAKLGFELEFWSRFAAEGAKADGYEERLTEATGVRYRASNFLSDMDADFYSADYLRAWIRSAQLHAALRREVGEDWWRSPETGERLRELFREGTKPTSEEIAARLGFDPLDVGPLVGELSLA